MGKKQRETSSMPPTGKSKKNLKKVETAKGKGQEKSADNCKKLGHEIEEIFATAKKRKASMNTLETVNSGAGAQQEKCKKLGHEIEEIFASAKKRKASMNTLDTVNPDAGAQVKRSKAKKKDETKKEKKTFCDPPSLPRKRTGDGLVIYSAGELGVGKANAGGTRLCPFDCDCCF